jgi:glycosyltransferase involved in cell wall biosynthesis
MKTAIIHEWFVTYRGSEKVVEQIIGLYPDADIFTLVDFLPARDRAFLQGKNIHTSFIQNFPFTQKYYRQYLPFMPLAIEQFDLSDYDLVISSNHCVAKGVLTGPNQLHISYIHTPMRYAWEMQHEYLRQFRLDRGIMTWPSRLLLHKLRIWDSRTANGVDYFIANSKFVANRIRKTYQREADVIYPPINISEFQFQEKKENYFLTASRLVQYKKTNLIIEAFNHMPEKKLIVIGDGPDLKKIKKVAKGNIEILGYQPDDILRSYMQSAKAFVYAAVDDFGIISLEAQACGTPVIAYGCGGSLETVRGQENPEPTGVFYSEQSAFGIINGVRAFENLKTPVNPLYCRLNAERFSVERFQNEFTDLINKACADYFN